MKGTVKWYDAVKGFGFIQSEDNKDLFVHRSGVKDNVFSLEAGQSVEFEIMDWESKLVESQDKNLPDIDEDFYEDFYE